MQPWRLATRELGGVTSIASALIHPKDGFEGECKNIPRSLTVQLISFSVTAVCICMQAFANSSTLIVHRIDRIEKVVPLAIVRQDLVLQLI